MKFFNKSIILFILFFSTLNFNFSYADFFEDTFNLKTNLEKLEFNFVTIKNYNLKDPELNKQNQILVKLNPIIQEAILKRYKNDDFGYYQTQVIVRDYNNFIYYSDKYFESLKDKEIYWNTPEVKRSIYLNFRNMKSYYYKFKDNLQK